MLRILEIVKQVGDANVPVLVTVRIRNGDRNSLRVRFTMLDRERKAVCLNQLRRTIYSPFGK